MKRRLTIARSLINDPELLLLDEPTTGLDPQARHVLWDRLFRLKQQGVTLVLTTHYMDEAEQLCDRLVVMDRGRIVAEGSPRELIGEHSTREVPSCASTPATTSAVRRRRSPASRERVEVLPDRLLLYTDDGEAAAAPVHAPRASSRCRRWCAGPPSRTCSCGSPAGRWWTDDGRPRQPYAAARPVRPRPRSHWCAAGSAPGYLATVYRRTWQGTSSPRFLVAAALPAVRWGCGSGSLVDGCVRRARRRRPTSPSSRRGCSPPRRCRSRWASRPSRCWARSSGSATYHAMLATPLGVARRRSSATCSLRRPSGSPAPRRSSWWWRPPFGAFAVVVGAALPAGRRAGRAGLRRADLRVHGARRRATAASTSSSGSVMIPLFLFSGTFFPISQLPRGAAAGRLG